MITTPTSAAKARFLDVMDKVTKIAGLIGATWWTDPDTANQLALEAFSYFYSDVEIEVGPQTSMIASVVAMLLLRPQVIAQLFRTRGDEVLSAFALETLWKLLNELFPPLKRAGSSQGEDDGMGGGEDEGGTGSASVEEVGDQLAKEIKRAAQAKEIAEAIVPATGWDLSKGKLVRTSLEDLENLAMLADRLEWLQVLADLVGRIEENGSLKKAMVAPRIKGEVYSVIRGGDLENMLPSETVLLADETLKLLFYSKMIERSLLAYEMKSASGEGDKDRGGPVIVMVDTSGSMKGESELVSKAIVLAISKIVRSQERNMLVGLFGSSGEYKELQLIDKSTNPSQFLGFLLQAFYGGTNLEDPLLVACAKILDKQWRFADVVVISDGMGLLSSRTRDIVRATKKKYNTTFWGVIVGRARGSGLDDVLDVKITMEGLEDVDARDLLVGLKQHH